MEGNKRIETSFEIPENFPTEMYILPGTTEVDFKFFYNKYKQSEEKFFKSLNLKEVLLEHLNNGKVREKLKTIELIVNGNFEEEFKKQVLETALKDEYWKINLKAIEIILEKNFEDLNELTEKVLRTESDLDVTSKRLKVLEIIENKNFNDQFKKEILFKSLKDEFWKVKLKAVEIILKENFEDLKDLAKKELEKTLEYYISEIRLKAAELTILGKFEDLNETTEEVLRQILADKNERFNFRLKVVEIIMQEKIENLKELAKKVLEESLDDYHLRLKSIEFIENKTLSDIDFKKEMLKKGLGSISYEVNLKSVEIILKEDFDDLKDLAKKVLVEIFNYLSKNSTIGYFHDNLYALELITKADFEEEFKIECKQKVDQNYSSKISKIENNLYKNTEMVFFREKFEKSGSETILLGNIPGSPKSFKDKIIIRIISLESFLAWKKAYEGYEEWKSAGFDYVPVEPILAFELQKDMKVRVYCAVLDQNIRQLEIPENRKLNKTLEDKLKINHGHLHNGNICVKFMQDEEGKNDYSVSPRQYIIDFDRAEEV